MKVQTNIQTKQNTVQNRKSIHTIPALKVYLEERKRIEKKYGVKFPEWPAHLLS